MPTVAHTNSFENAISVIRRSTHTYSATLSSEWAIGDAPHGGYLAAIFYRVSKVHMATTHPGRHGGQAAPINMQLTFLRRCNCGSAELVVEDVKIGRRTSVISVALCQGGTRRVAGHITVSNPNNEKRAPFKFTNTTDSILPGAHRCLWGEDSGSPLSPPWERVDIPHPSFRRAPSHVEAYHLPNSPRGAGGDLTSTQCALLAWSQDGNVVRGRWTNEAVTFLADIFPVPLAMLEEAVQLKHRTSNPVWFPTLSLNIDFKRALPDDGERVILSRIAARCISEDRMTVEVELKDAAGQIVALANHATLIMSPEVHSTPKI